MAPVVASAASVIDSRVCELQGGFQTDEIGLSKELMLRGADNKEDVSAAVPWQDYLRDSPHPSFPSFPSNEYRPFTNSQVQQKCKVSYSASFESQIVLITAAWALILSRYENQEDVIFAATSCYTEHQVPVKLSLSKQHTVPVLFDLIRGQMKRTARFEKQSLRSFRKIATDFLGAGQPRTSISVMKKPVDGRLEHELQDKNAFAIVLHCVVAEADIKCGVSFDASVVDHEQSSRLLWQFEAVFRQLEDALKEESFRLVANVSTISTADLQELQSWQPPPLPAIDTSLHEVVHIKAIQCAQNIAVNAWDGDLTYTELDHFSDIFAQVLVEKGVKHGEMIPFCLPKSCLVAVAMLGICKAGATFVPLPYEVLTHRTRHVVETVEARLIVTSPEKVKVFREVVELPLAITPQLIRTPPSQIMLLPKVRSTDAALVIFTSGSTGVPKGVVLEHRALVTSFHAIVERLGLTMHSRIVQFAAHTFDNSLCDYFATLFAGGCVCIPSAEERESDLTGFILRHNVNTMKITPSVARMIDPSDIPSVKTLILGAEPLMQEDVTVWSSRLRLIQSYGPSECAVFSVSTSQIMVGDVAANIGRGFSTSVWLVLPEDSHQLAPIGAVGEMLLEGPVLAREYLKAEKLTAEQFIYDPDWTKSFGATCRRRFYKTGDLARYNSNGTITILGRKDSQVKIRGQRLELGEVEHQIRNHVPVSMTVIVEMIRSPSTPGTGMLIAFLCAPARETTPGVRRASHPTHAYFDVTPEQKNTFEQLVVDLSSSLKLALPSYMIPSAFVPLREIPLNASAKTDRKKLRELASEMSPEALLGRSAGSDHTFTPCNEQERILGKLWSQILRTDAARINTSDNFYHLSGDSLKAMGLASLARKIGFGLSVKDILANPSFADMASKMNARESEASSYLPFCLLPSTQAKENLLAQLKEEYQVSRDAVEDIYPCTPLQEGLMALSLKQANSYVIQKTFPVRPDVDLPRLCAAWERVVAATPSLRTRFLLSEHSEIFQAVTKDPLHWQEQGTDLESYLAEDLQRPMGLGDLTSRYRITQDGRSQKYFVWTLHHAICDGNGIRLILENVEKSYQHITTDFGNSFGAFVKYLKMYDEPEASDFWKSQLAGSRASTFPALPLPSYQCTARGELSISVQLNKWKTSSFTPATFAKAAWALLMARYEGIPDVVFGMISNGRSAAFADIETLPGPTFATLPIRASFREEQTLETFLQSLQSQAISMIPHEHTGLQTISSLSPDCSVACQFRTMLIIQDYGRDQSGVLFDYKQSRSDRALTYPVTVECTTVNDEVTILMTYDTALVDTRQARRLLHQFERVLQQLRSEENKNIMIADLTFVSDLDLRELRSWNATSFQPSQLTIHELVEIRVRHRPQGEAVSSWDGTLSYVELDDYATRLAVFIRDLQPVGTPLFVPTCLEKSKWAVVTMLAILKAGGACVPLPFSEPTSREQEVLDNFGSSIVLVSPYFAASYVPLVENVVLITGAFIQRLPFISRMAPAYSQAAAILSNPAFIVHTSGSTGKPKGVVQEHASLSPALQHLIEVSRLTKESRVFQFSAFTFDVSFSDIFATLIAGGCVCLPSENDRLNDMSKAIDELKANYAYLTPTVARLLTPASVPTLKGMELVGEAVSRDLVETWSPHLDLYNNYGPSECGILCIRTTSTMNTGKSPANIGSGFSVGVWITLPDDHNALTPIGAIGEMLLSGDVLAQGYLSQPTVTAAAFVHNPKWTSLASGHGDMRFYKTGDLARFEPDGSIEFIGRKDSQVKFRGQRVELGGIEAQLSKHLPVGAHVMVDVVKAADEKEPVPKLVAFYNVPEQDRGVNDDTEDYIDLV